MKKTVRLLSSIVVVFLVITVKLAFDRVDAVSELQDVSSSYSEVVESVGGLTGVVIIQQIDDVRSMMHKNKLAIDQLEKTKKETEEMIQKYIDSNSVLQETANILKEKAREEMGLN